MDISVQTGEDGSFSIHAGAITIADCYPGINSRPLHPVRVSSTSTQSGHVIEYTTPDGAITIELIREQDGLAIRSSIVMPGKRILTFCPIYKATLTGINGMYRQGLGIGGPSGYVSLSAFKGNDNILKMFKSFGIVSLVAGDGALSLFPDAHNRFTAIFDIVKLDRDDYRELFSAGYNIEGIDVSNLSLPSLKLAHAETLGTGLDAAAVRIAANAGVRQVPPPPLVWCSWYYLFHNLSHRLLKEYLKGFASIKPAIPFEYVQIDAGYFPSAGDWLEPNALWPEGLAAGFDEISSFGYKPGIWIAPYMVANRSRLYKDHPDWILMRNDGTPVVEMTCYNEPKMSGYRDEEYYVLDTSNPAAMEYLRGVFKTMRRWGALYFKTDFMLWGLQNSSKVKRHSPGRTSIEYVIDLLKVIREEIGDKSFWLGCIAPFYPFLGFADAMRIAGDVGARWTVSEFGTTSVIREIIGCNYFNHVYWRNDPDAMILRDFHVHLDNREIESLCLAQAVCGGMISSSEPFHELGAERRELLRFVMPDRIRKPVIPFLDNEPKEVVMTHDLGDGKHLLFILNPAEEAMTRKYALRNLIGRSSAHVRQWKHDGGSASATDSIVVTLERHACTLFFVSETAPVTGDPQNMWHWG